ncbi:hypothetical protein [Burkholderia gladioli]|uniref:hypothetical protein n=1 Tax=Burkholderia gladioli TaxID=28095 RepID=UPI000BBD1458|nr:hypothetical protein [Burkholderia gladioli]ATF87570.1 hypothetical protein CO712_20920 [Burkholderia gladioli pv. gladioli]
MATTITDQIVKLNVVVTQAPTSSQLQQSGALVSLGGTTLTPGNYQYTGQLSDLESILSSGGNEAELLNMGTSFYAQGTAVGCYVLELGTATGVDAQIALLQAWITQNPGVFYAYLVPAAWDFSKDEVGSVILTSGGSGYTSAPSVTFSAPTTGTTATGTAVIQNGAVVQVNITNPGSGYTSAPTVTFSGGAGTGATGTANLVSGLSEMASQYASATGKTYFFVTTSAVNLPNYATQKSVFAVQPSPTAASTEFQAAGPFYQWLVNSPSASNRLAPMSYRYMTGLTPWSKKGNQAAINTALTGYGNLVLTGAEGGISTAALFKGTLMDGSQASWWYGIDWFQIQAKQALAAAIINGSNQNPPLLYDQPGINALLAVAQNVANNAVTFGCALSVTVSAIPFATYTAQNPNDYKAGQYGGLSATAVGQNGFLTITFNLDAVQFA